MLSRRHIRIKVLQALYGFFQSEDMAMSAGERKLSKSINRIYELYLYELKSLTAIKRLAEDQIERNKNKKLPTASDLNPNMRFVENSFLQWLDTNENFKLEVEKFHISWNEEKEILKKTYLQFQESEEYETYMSAETHTTEDDRKIVKMLYGKFLVNSEIIHQLYEEKDMYWADDLDAAQMMVAKTLKSFDDKSDENTQLQRLLKDREDLDFAVDLYKKVINKNAEFEKLIHEKAKNWEMDRIAFVDVILMKMALAEMLTFTQIPIKVTLNEYIELGKEYSTPKSGNFINGILDKLKLELTESGAIKKIGRGLL